MSAKTLLQILLLFSSLSLLSIGGGNTVLPEMHYKSVGDYHWLTDSQFADVFAISQAAPGPSILIVTLIGYKAGLAAGGELMGVFGAILATAAMMVPAGLLVYLCRAVLGARQELQRPSRNRKGLRPAHRWPRSGERLCNEQGG